MGEFWVVCGGDGGGMRVKWLEFGELRKGVNSLRTGPKSGTSSTSRSPRESDGADTARWTSPEEKKRW